MSRAWGAPDGRVDAPGGCPQGPASELRSCPGSGWGVDSLDVETSLGGLPGGRCAEDSKLSVFREEGRRVAGGDKEEPRGHTSRPGP